MNTLNETTKLTLEQIEEKRAMAMGEARRDEQRQIIGLLYEQMMNDLQLMNAVKATAESIAVPKPSVFSQKKHIKTIQSPWVGVVLSALTCVCALSGFANWICALCALLTLSQAIAGILLKKSDEDTLVLSTETTISFDESLYERIIQKRMNELEKACMDVIRLSQPMEGGSMDAHALAQLYGEIYTMDQMQDVDQAKYCCHLMKMMLEQHDLGEVAYSSETAHLYNTTPSDMVELTLCPAICRLSDQQLITKGQHYTKEEQIGA